MKRRLQNEKMDQPGLDPALHRQALQGLARLNRFTGVASEMYRRIRSIGEGVSGRPVKLLDVASGSGDLPISWALRAKRERLDLEITTIDFSELAIEEQIRRSEDAGVTIRAICGDCIAADLPTGYDLCTNSLFLHHLSEEQAVALIRKMANSAAHVVLCDLERTWLNRLQVMLASRLVTRSPIVHFDARCSIEGAFSKQEFSQLLHTACQQRIAVRRLLPCRMIATVHRDQMPCRV